MTQHFDAQGRLIGDFGFPLDAPYIGAGTPDCTNPAASVLAHLRQAFPQYIPEGHAVVILPLPASAIPEESDQYLQARLQAPQITLRPGYPTTIAAPLSQSLGSVSVQLPCDPSEWD